MERSPVRGRALTAVLMLFTFAVLVVSGVVLYVTPRDGPIGIFYSSTIGKTCIPRSDCCF